MAVIRLDTETRQLQIKKAVLEIIAEQGLAKLTTRNLANKVGVSEGTIFKHFKNKNEIILSIIEDVRIQLIKRQKAIAFGNNQPQDRLFEFLCTHVQYLIENKGITILLFSEAAYFNQTELKSQLLNILNEQRKYLSKIVNDGIKKGIWDPKIKIEKFVSLYMGIPISLNVEMILKSYNFQANNFCKNMIYLLERILKK